ncbi:5-formyltetrahydrofolate cyclo-ligase [Pseudaeromonas sp. ZJS20]|uniref:5-formyltetrahydrofolate cyclo-ligase n=1 Tax=Pseudaeromonas aegiceratis TaxID=3153928 RepID=UPI00390C86D1
MLDRQSLREMARRHRQSLSPHQQQQAATQLKARFIQHPKVQAADTLALYLAMDGELSTQACIQWCWEAGKRVCLPVLHPVHAGHLLFLAYEADTPMQHNRFGIPEPRLDSRTVVPLEQLSLIFTPLVAFDSQGNRLGMGGGFYDRTLAQWHQHRQGPYPIGLAHDCQRVEQIPSEAWDVPLPEILTPGHHWIW